MKRKHQGEGEVHTEGKEKTFSFQIRGAPEDVFCFNWETCDMEDEESVYKRGELALDLSELDGDLKVHSLLEQVTLIEEGMKGVILYTNQKSFTFEASRWIYEYRIPEYQNEIGPVQRAIRLMFPYSPCNMFEDLESLEKENGDNTTTKYLEPELLVNLELIDSRLKEGTILKFAELDDSGARYILLKPETHNQADEAKSFVLNFIGCTYNLIGVHSPSITLQSSSK